MAQSNKKSLPLYCNHEPQPEPTSDKPKAIDFHPKALNPIPRDPILDRKANHRS
ncbi:hypothetical protein COLO4_05812 [Corchorus olitorius]|uniref:Uncharacterized protein n=1 Tax=Corchorus olitorius TaxID=93759 RepID=A0A1R3KPS9_9ROSI|nr:hypothetical protein COLO4_05812 [Corchorus olitorius]